MWSLAGSQAVDQPSATLGLGHMAGVSATLGLCGGQLASAPGAHPPEVSGVGPQSTNLGAHNQASGESWGCLARFTVQGLRGEGCQRPGLLWRVL